MELYPVSVIFDRILYRLRDSKLGQIYIVTMFMEFQRFLQDQIKSECEQSEVSLKVSELQSGVCSSHTYTKLYYEITQTNHRI